MIHMSINVQISGNKNGSIPSFNGKDSLTLPEVQIFKRKLQEIFGRRKEKAMLQAKYRLPGRITQNDSTAVGSDINPSVFFRISGDL
jgi:hypothetical protein